VSDPAATSDMAAVSDPGAAGDLAVRLARLAGALRSAGVGTTLRDELDAAVALTLVDLADRDEVRHALRIALKIPRPAFATFDQLLGMFWARRSDASAPPEAPVSPTHSPTARRETAVLPRGRLRWDPDARRLLGTPGEAGQGEEQSAGKDPGYSREAALRRKSFAEIDGGGRDLAVMERLLARLGRRLATRRSRRLVPTRGRGLADLRASTRKALRTSGELFTLARRARPVERPRLVFLCDTSGSMDTHARFLLTFVLSLRRAVRGAEVFAFNTELVWLTPLLAHGDLAVALDRLRASVPDWSGGTRIGDSLAAFVKDHLARSVDAKTTVVILSDGLDRGDPAQLAEVVRLIRRRARKLIWLNPLLGDPDYQPTARGMQAALPFVDHFAAAHDIESLERLLPHLRD
jgi:uncharacterized protein with von Willebrand factor type A (vWA) domain